MRGNDHHISVREGVAAITILTCGKLFLGLPRTFAIYGASAGWIVALLTTTHGPLIFWGMNAIFKRYPGKSLMAATEAIFGPVIGTMVNFLYSFYFFWFAITVVREYGDSIVIAFLPRTPLPAVLLLLLAAGLYAANLGIEPLARTSWLGGPFMLAGYAVLAAAALMTHREPRALAPYWGTGVPALLQHGLTYNVMGDFLLYGIIAPVFHDGKEWRRAFWLTIILSSFLIVGSEIIYLTVFPYPAAARVVLPLMQVSRTISLGPGVQRVEGFFFIIWGSAGMLKLSLGIFGAVSSLAQTLRLPTYRQLLLPLGILIFHLAMLPRNVTLAYWSDQALRYAGTVITILVPLITALVAWALKKGAKSRAQGQKSGA